MIQGERTEIILDLKQAASLEGSDGNEDENKRALSCIELSGQNRSTISAINSILYYP